MISPRASRERYFFFWNHHAATAQLGELTQLCNGIFVLAFVFANHRAHFRFHELADGVANQKLIACERKIHSERCTRDASTACASRQSGRPPTSIATVVPTFVATVAHVPSDRFCRAGVRLFTPACYNFNNSRSRFVCARDTGISDCRLSFILSM
jgi:hypothetical protein